MEQLGIEPKLLFAQIVNFTIIIFVLTKLLYKPILGMLEKRKKEIEAGLLMSEKMKKEEERLREKQEKMLDQTRKEARVILEEAQKQGGVEEKRIVGEAHEQAEEIIRKGKAQVERLHDEMQKDVTKEAVTLAVAMSKRLMGNIFSEKDQHRLITEHLKQLESMKGEK